MPVLSRSQRNDVYKLAEKVGLRIDDFDLASEDQQFRGAVEKFTHRPTQCWIDFSLAHEGKFWLHWWPKFGHGDPSAFIDDWERGVLPTVQQWVRTVRTNDDAPDLWAEAHKSRNLSDAAGQVDADNTPFDLAEIDLLKPRLAEIEAYIESRQPLDANQKRELQGRFQYVLGAAKRGLGRLDWLNILVSQIIKLFIDGMLHPSHYGDVMRHAYVAVTTVIKVGAARLLGS